MFELTGHRALVTGAGDGMGVGIAHALARQGAAVAVNDIVAAKADATRDAILAAGGTAVSAPFDITDESAVNAGIAAAAEALGGHIDILVNNAGIPADMAADPLPRPAARPLALVHRHQSLRVAALHRRGDRADGGGALGTHHPDLVRRRTHRAEDRRLAVRRVQERHRGLHPPPVDGGRLDRRDGERARPRADGRAEQDRRIPAVTAGIARSIPVGRLGTPDDVGAAVVFLASDETEWMTGQTVNLNGGSTFS